VPAGSVRPVLPGRHPPRGRDTPRLSEQPTPARGRSRPMDGRLTMAGSRALVLTEQAGTKCRVPGNDGAQGRPLMGLPDGRGAPRVEDGLRRFEHEPVNGATDMNLYTADLMAEERMRDRERDFEANQLAALARVRPDPETTTGLR